MKMFGNGELENCKAEAQERWGKTDAYQEHAEKTKNYSKDQWSVLADQMSGIMADFAACMKCGATPDSNQAQALVEMLQSHITEQYYTCTKEILSSLGQMYVADERFRNNIDKHGDGTAEFISQAVKIYTQQT